MTLLTTRCASFLTAVALTLFGAAGSNATADAIGAALNAVSDTSPPHDATTGTMNGAAGTESGASTYSIPLVLPPGRAGMQPSLTLSYNSRRGDGLAGMGWALEGLSTIHRCPQTPEQD